MDPETRRAFAMGLGYGLGVCIGLGVGATLGREARARLEARREARVFLPTTPATRVELDRDGIHFIDPPATEPTDGVGDPAPTREGMATNDGD